MYFNKSLLSDSDNMLLSYINWEPFNICSRGVYDEYIDGGSSRTWIQTTKESFLSNDFNRGKSPRLFSYQHFSPNICVPLWWSSPSVLPLWFSEVNIGNLKTVPIISLRASETARCCWTAPTLKCRTVAAFVWGRWAEFMQGSSGTSVCVLRSQGSLQIYWNFMKNSYMCAFHWRGSQWTHRIMRFWGTESLRNDDLKNEGDGFLFYFYLIWA